MTESCSLEVRECVCANVCGREKDMEKERRCQKMNVLSFLARMKQNKRNEYVDEKMMTM